MNGTESLGLGSMHQWNQLLPAQEREGVLEDAADSQRKVDKSTAAVEACVARGEPMGNRELGKLLRLLGEHWTMKYKLEDDSMLRLLNGLTSLYLQGGLPTTMKIKLVSALKGLTKRCAEVPLVRSSYALPWRALWREILGVVEREDRHLAACSENVLVDLLTALVGFLHGARQFVKHQDAEGGAASIVVEAAKLMQDPRYPPCLEGLLLLVNCLPTDYSGYAEVLPTWVQCWVGNGAGGVWGLDHNAQWDYAWLTLLARARKHVPQGTGQGQYDWAKLLPTLLNKAHELLQVPACPGVEAVKLKSTSQFPRCFQAHQARLLLVQSASAPSPDSKVLALRKLAKLLHFITIQPAELIPAPPLGISPPGPALPGITAARAQLALDGGGEAMVLAGAGQVMVMMQALRPYFNPANQGAYTPALAQFFLVYVLQLCRHVGHELATAVSGSQPRDKAYLPPMHLPTAKYLATHLLPYCLEGLYAPNPYLSQFCSACIKNLVAVHPSACGPIIVPFLLAALDPAAVSQAHQAPIAMQTLATCFRGLMYPQPVLLPYLPQILRLCLPGIEPSDVTKTSYTLHLYSTVLAWLPTTLSVGGTGGVEGGPPPYLSLIQQAQEQRGLSAGVGVGSGVGTEELEKHLSDLSDYMGGEWCLALVERLFVTLEAQEQDVVGAKASPLAGAIGQCATYLFQALRPLHPSGLSEQAQQLLQDKQTALRLAVQGRVRSFFAASTPLNAAKGSAKLMEAMVTSDVALLPAVLADLLDPNTSSAPAPSLGGLSAPVVVSVADALLNAYSADKVAFRLRLAGGACRAATGEQIALCLPRLLLPILTSQAFISHEEKAVRTATCKLLKDVLKGSCSFYPTNLEPRYASNADKVPGSPNMGSLSNLQWYVPSQQGVQAVLPLLRASTSDTMAAVKEQLAVLVEGDKGGKEGGAKKSEELLVNRLCILEKALRGSAELLGDANPPTPTPARMLNTGRGAVLASLSDADAAYLNGLREEVLCFLAHLQQSILDFAPALASTADAPPPPPDSSAPTASATASADAHPVASLRNSVLLQGLWAKILQLVVTRRMACLHDVEVIRSHMSFSMLNAQSSVSKVVCRRMKQLKEMKEQGQGGEVTQVCNPVTAGSLPLSELEYWRMHDCSTSGIACMAWIQHVRRCRALSFGSIRARCGTEGVGTEGTEGAADGTGDPFSACLDLLLVLCSHEYQKVRQVALKAFESVSSRFGFKMGAIVTRLLTQLQGGGQGGALSYPAMSGALNLLLQGRVQKRVLGEPGLLLSFLQALLLRSQGAVLAATDEADKRERLVLLVVEALLKYVNHWCTLPQAGGDDALMQLALSVVGAGGAGVVEVGVQGDGVQGEGEGVGSEEGAKAVTQMGLRFETFAAFMPLHLIGRPSNGGEGDVVMGERLWEWVLSKMGTDQHGEPTQAIALSALSRIAWICSLETHTHSHTQTEGLKGGELGRAGRGSGSACAAGLVGYRNAKLRLSPYSPSNTLRALFAAASQSHPVSEEARAQWGRGIEHVAHAANFLKSVVPRSVSGRRCDRNQYSAHFRKEDAITYLSLARSGLFNDPDSAMEGYSVQAEQLQVLFKCAEDLPSSTEGELRSNNTTRAELFAGLLRAHRLAASRGTFSPAQDTEAQGVFLGVLREGFEKGSMDFCKDWEEAMCFAFVEVPLSLEGDAPKEQIPAYLIDRLLDTVLKQTQGQGAGDEGAGGDSGESFSAQSKVMKLICALLQADQEACFAEGAREKEMEGGWQGQEQGQEGQQASLFGSLLLRVLAQQGPLSLVSPFRDTRGMIAFMLATLAENVPCGQDAQVIQLCVGLAGVTASAAAAVALSLSGAEDEAGTVGGAVMSPAALLHKNATETVCTLMHVAVQKLPLWRLHGAWASLFQGAVAGAGSMASSALETAKMSHDASLLLANAALRQAPDLVSLALAGTPTPTPTPGTGTGPDMMSSLLSVLDAFSKDTETSLHSRETVMQCLALLMGNNWSVLGLNEKKTCMAILTRGLEDSKPEVQQLAQAGMVLYLSFKTLAELASIAAVYTKNSDILATREKKLRKQGDGTKVGGGVDSKHQNTILMMSCLIIATPYDLPTYVPALLGSFVRHAAVSALRDTVTRTVQLFKRTHTDRWEEFREAFSTDQLDELQGTGAAHYYS